MTTRHHGEPPQRLHAIVQGRVQGVNFRAYTIRAAKQLDLTGWVCNRSDGTVETVAEGASTALDAFERFLHQGSPSAAVHDVQASREAASGEFSGFQVRYG